MKLLRYFRDAFTVESHVVHQGRPVRGMSELFIYFIWLMIVTALALYPVVRP